MYLLFEHLTKLKTHKETPSALALEIAQGIRNTIDPTAQEYLRKLQHAHNVLAQSPKVR